jgi:hypothetical protein
MLASAEQSIMPEHIYWATCCKTAECRCLFLVYYIGLCERSSIFSLPSQAGGEFVFQCSHCGEKHTYIPDNFAPIADSDPPDKDFLPWF